MYVNDSSMRPSFILYAICILFFCLSLYFIYIFFNKLRERHLFKTFIYINLTTVNVFIFYGLSLLYKTIVTELMLLLLIFITFTSLVSLASIPLNLISEYGYFKKKLNLEIKMPEDISRNTINLSKAIWLVKIQAIIFVVGIVLAAYFSWSRSDNVKFNVIYIFIAPFAVLIETIYYKIYSLLFICDYIL